MAETGVHKGGSDRSYFEGSDRIFFIFHFLQPLPENVTSGEKPRLYFAVSKHDALNSFTMVFLIS